MYEPETGRKWVLGCSALICDRSRAIARPYSPSLNENEKKLLQLWFVSGLSLKLRQSPDLKCSWAGFTLFGRRFCRHKCIYFELDGKTRWKSCVCDTRIFCNKNRETILTKSILFVKKTLPQMWPLYGSVHQRAQGGVDTSMNLATRFRWASDLYFEFGPETECKWKLRCTALICARSGALTRTNSPSLNENVKGYNRLKKLLQLHFRSGLCLKTESMYEQQLGGFSHFCTTFLFIATHQHWVRPRLIFRP